MPPAKTNKSGISGVRVSKEEKITSQSKTTGELLMVSFRKPTTPDGRLREDISTDPTVYLFDKSFSVSVENIRSGSLVLSIGRIIRPEYNDDICLIEIVSPTGRVGVVNVLFLYRLDQAALESLSKQNK